MIILLHTSKTMRVIHNNNQNLHSPILIDKTCELASYLKTLSPQQLMNTMHTSALLAAVVAKKYTDWNIRDDAQSPAIDSFIGDIYSGLQASTFTKADREYADAHLRILSGLYGILRPLDGVLPYRLEMGYKLPRKDYSNLYNFWGDTIVRTLPAKELIINLASVEYSRLITPFVDSWRVITPKFLTINEKTQQPTFVVVHAKIARGAFARWLITSRVTSSDQLHMFDDIGYHFDESLSSPNEPVFICNTFGGIGLSLRLEKK